MTTTLTLLEAAKAALATAESHIRDQYEGTKGYQEQLADLQPVRDAIARAAWDPLTPERLAALHGEPIHTRYWLVLRGWQKPLEAHTLRFGGDTCFAHGPRVFYAHEVSHIMPFHTPEMP